MFVLWWTRYYRQNRVWQEAGEGNDHVSRHLSAIAKPFCLNPVVIKFKILHDYNEDSKFWGDQHHC